MSSFFLGLRRQDRPAILSCLVPCCPRRALLAASKALDTVRPERSKILIVDDEPLNVDLLEQQLEELGYETVSAANG